MEINSIDDFFEFIKIQTDVKVDNFWHRMYRGVSNSEYKLIPSIGRLKSSKGNKIDIGKEISMFNEFENMVFPYIKEYNFNTLELLSFGRHHGLPTRLLDWTQNPLVAAYFAVEKPFNETEKKQNDIKSCIYIHKEENLIETCEPFDPFKINHVRYYVPKNLDNRIIAQVGLFTVHNDPYTPWEPNDLETVFINKNIREKIRVVLNRIWVNASSLYPGVDGISEYIRKTWTSTDTL